MKIEKQSQMENILPYRFTDWQFKLTSSINFLMWEAANAGFDSTKKLNEKPARRVTC